MENLKTNWKLPEKTKNPRSPTGNLLQENWKHSENSRKKLKFSLKNCKIGRQGRENSPQSARQKSPTALKRLDISIKRTLKIGHRLCWFCAIQQRKEPVTSFMSQAFVSMLQKRYPIKRLRQGRCFIKHWFDDRKFCIRIPPLKTAYGKGRYWYSSGRVRAVQSIFLAVYTISV